LSTALSAPVTELATFYFEGAPPKDHLEGVHKFRQLAEEKKWEGYLGSAAGITYEEVEREGVKGKAAVLAIGWTSVDAHMVSSWQSVDAVVRVRLTTYVLDRHSAIQRTSRKTSIC
jgi:hypothetical protein